nr:class E sortase [Nocardioidaceae bacterium]
GVGRDDLKRGPGHYPQTPLPGQLGNAAIAGHRTTYGEPFADIDQMLAGDKITVTTPAGTFTYLVDESRIVAPSDGYVLDTVDEDVARLTLTSCHPRYSASQRIVVSAELAARRSSPVGEPVINYGRPPGDEAQPRPAETIPGARADETRAPPDTSQPDGRGSGNGGVSTRTAPPAPAAASDRALDPEVDPFAAGWFADAGAYPQLAIWAALLIALAAAGYLVCRRFRNDWSGPLLVAVPFLVALYFFYQNVNRLLPAAL